MALPYIDALTKSERAALPFLTAAANQGLSANEALRQLSAAGMGIRRANALSIYSDLQDQVNARPYFKSVNLNARLDPSRLGQALTKTTGLYTYTVKSTGVNTLTGEKTERFVNVIADTLLTKQEALDTAQAIFDTAMDQYGHVSGQLVVDDILVSQ